MNVRRIAFVAAMTFAIGLIGFFAVLYVSLIFS